MHHMSQGVAKEGATLPGSKGAISIRGEQETHATSSKCGEGRVTRKQRWNRNMKGESLLHRACISGNFKLASSLIDKDHPLIMRDYAGWTPLHEACNHGHLDIVRLLLDSGAPVNNVDDTICEGISPLHDALSNGHLEIAELLIDRGASLTRRDTEGRTPADCCRQWSRDVKVEPSPETTGKCAAVLSVLEEALLHIDTTTQRIPRETDNFNMLPTIPSLGPELKLLAQSSQYLHGKHSGECSLPSSSVESPDSHLTSSHWLSEGHGNGAVFSISRSLAKTQCQGRLSLSKRKESADLSQPATSRLVSSTSSSRWSTEEDDDFISSPRPFKKQCIRAGQRSSAHQKGSEASSGNISSHLLPSSVEQREKSTGHSVATPSKSSQSSMSTGKSSSKSSQSSMSTGKSSSKSSQPSTSTTLLFDNQTQSSVMDSSPSVTHPPSKDTDWLDGDGLEDEWLEVDRSHSKEALSQLARPVTPVVGETQGSSPRPVESRASLLGDRTANAPTQPDASLSQFQTPQRNISKAPVHLRMPGWSTSQPRGQDTLASPSSSSSPPPQTPYRVKVRVKEKLFLIAVPSSDSDSYTILWLTKEAETRYHQECDLRPRLSLTSGGALLSPHDPIINLLHDNEEVLAEVLSWDLPPISVRYKRACDSLALAEDSSMSKILQLQENGSSIDLSNLSLNKEHLTPILRALKLQNATRRLCLSANRLGDDAMDELLASLVTMPNLTLLDLSSNCITHEGLRKLCDPSTSSRDTPFQSLEELNLSLNPLGDGSSQLIASLIRSCPRLSTLKLQACGLTARFLQNMALSCTLKGSRHLKTLILSHNDLGFKGVQFLLRNLAHDVLSHLEIASVLGNHDDRPFMGLVTKYLSQGGCVMTHLNLSKNSLTDDSIGEFSRCLESFPALASLDLSQNPGITSSGMEALLTAFAKKDSWMEVLDLSGCSVDHNDIRCEAASWNLGDLRL
ncbi:tonsoku-like protein [Scyliorhinus canicula]|uniref:tonsoku-like protein n=1 Tax=Scyliorhinus canicula TaxID=7830 RepID=UPI0018F2E070|nr:tonsoku-like protein [Scyliorhinus canicula]